MRHSQAANADSNLTEGHPVVQQALRDLSALLGTVAVTSSMQAAQGVDACKATGTAGTPFNALVALSFRHTDAPVIQDGELAGVYPYARKRVAYMRTLVRRCHVMNSILAGAKVLNVDGFSWACCVSFFLLHDCSAFHIFISVFFEFV